MNSRFIRHLQFSLITLDIVAINTVFFLVEFIFRKQLLIADYIEYTYLCIFLNLAWIVVSLVANIYNEKKIISFELFSKHSAYSFIYFLVLIVFYLYFFKQFIIYRGFTLVLLYSIPTAILFNRFLYLVIYRFFKKKDYLINKVVIIGYNELSKKLVGYLEGDVVNKEIIGYCEEFNNVHELSKYPILGSIANALETCIEHGVTEIYSTIAPEHNIGIYQLMRKADEHCIRFKIVPDISFFVKKQFHIEFLHEMPIISFRKEPLEDLGNRIRKRLFDILVSSLVVIFILSWLMPLVGLLIWLEQRGPILFVQIRSGKDNKSFPCLKFRSMRINNTAHEKQATKNDIRITRVGRFLRRTSLDEFPQFINVLKGEMSVVGPRPHMLKHTDVYSRLIKQYMVRQFLKPGITGWAQVNGLRGETKDISQMQKRVEHDLWYMENWSMWIDSKIIFLTVFNTFKGEENAF